MRSVDCSYDAKEAPQWLAKVPSRSSQSPTTSIEPERASTSTTRLTPSSGVGSTARTRSGVPTVEQSGSSSARDDERQASDAGHDTNARSTSVRGGTVQDLKW
jgi:hypothetical protein